MELELNDLTYKINGCTMKVHNYLGNGFKKLFIKDASQ